MRSVLFEVKSVSGSMQFSHVNIFWLASSSGYAVVKPTAPVQKEAASAWQAFLCKQKTKNFLTKVSQLVKPGQSTSCKEALEEEL